MSKLLRCILRSQHKHPLGRRQVVSSIVRQYIVTHNAFALNHVEQRHTHAALRGRRLAHRLLIVLQASPDIDSREVDGVAPQNMFRLNGSQHGIGPAEFRLALILDGCYG